MHLHRQTNDQKSRVCESLLGPPDSGVHFIGKSNPRAFTVVTLDVMMGVSGANDPSWLASHSPVFEMNAKSPSKSKSIWLFPVLALLAGTAVGAVASVLKFERPEMRLPGNETTQVSDLDTTNDSDAIDHTGHDHAMATDTTGSDAVIKDALPRVFLPGDTEYDFGVMARNEKQSHSFKVKNIGPGPLTLTVLDTTCKCTVGSLEKDSIASGEEVDVTLTWETLSYDREFRQSATIETNDGPNREIVFSVYGKVVQLATPDLPEMQFSRVSRSEAKTYSTVVYGYRDDDLLIVNHEFSDPKLAEFFDVSYKPLPKEEWDDSRATSAVRCTVDIKPGLPIGEVKQGIRLRTNKKDIPPLAISVQMHIVSDISIIGRNFRSKSNLLILGHVDSDAGANANLVLIVKGDHQKDVELSVEKADPDGVLSAEFGEPKDVNQVRDGKEISYRQIPMKVMVAKGAKGTFRMGNKQGPHGVLTIKTNHPEVEQFDLQVKFLVK